MSTQNSLLAQSEKPAAMGRFLYGLPDEQIGRINTIGLHDANERFYERYREYLKHPLNQVATLEIAQAEDASVPPLYAALGFDITWANEGILGWYLSVTERARDVTIDRLDTSGSMETRSVYGTAPISTHGCRVFMEYTAKRQAAAAMRRLDAQGRSYSSLLIANGDRAVSAPAMHDVVTRLLDQADVNRTFDDFQAARLAAALKVVILLRKQEQAPTKAAAKQLQQARDDFEKIGFKQMHRNFPVTKPWETTDNGANQTAIATIEA